MKAQRIFGLDVLRILAIGMVIFSQFLWILPSINPLILQAASVIQFMGLEAFFVLSGFLMYVRLYPLYLQENLGWKSFRQFVVNRLRQILPLYFLALMLNLIFVLVLDIPISVSWKYFLLVQNFTGPMTAFFHESWGVTIVLFGNVLFPLSLFAFTALFRPINKKAFFLWITILLIALFAVAKVMYNSTSANTDRTIWDAWLKSVVIYRLDSVFIGVLAGWMLYNRPLFFKRIKVLSALAGVFGIAFLLVGVGYLDLDLQNHPAFWNVFYLPLTSSVICCFLPIVYEWKSASKLFKENAAFGSNITYAFYLLNCGLVIQFLHYYFSKTDMGNAMASILIMLYFLIILRLSVILHKYFQLKFLK